MTELFTLPKRDPILFSGLAAVFLLAAAYGFQLYGYAPCELCWWQRYPYMAIAAIALVATAIKLLPRRIVLGVLGLLFLTDAGIAAFHVGVEQRWWKGLETCSGFVDVADNINDALSAIMNAPLVRCDEIAWSLFGVSMAGYNFLIALGLGLYALGRARRPL